MTERAARWLVERECAAFARMPSRPGTRDRLTVASAWQGPIRGAIEAAARQGLALAAKPDLITVAARAARERLRLARSAGLRLGAAAGSLLVLPESWAIACVREIARGLLLNGDAWRVPTCEEALTVGERLAPVAREKAIPTPAADFLDGFSRAAAGGTSRRPT